MATGDPVTVEPAFVGEDLYLEVTIAGDGSIAGRTYTFRAWDPDGAEHSSGLAVSVTDADNRVVTASITGRTLATGRHKFEVRRADSGYRTVAVWGYIPVREYRP